MFSSCFINLISLRKITFLGVLVDFYMSTVELGLDKRLTGSFVAERKLFILSLYVNAFWFDNGCSVFRLVELARYLMDDGVV